MFPNILLLVTFRNKYSPVLLCGTLASICLFLLSIYKKKNFGTKCIAVQKRKQIHKSKD